MSEKNTSSVILNCVSRIVAAYVSSHKVPLEDVPDICARVKRMLMSLHSSRDISSLNLPTKQPAVPIDESVFDDYIICLEDGRPLQMLKRHIKAVYGLSLDQYKERWNLPESYPVVAPSYARKRSDIAKNIGLGRASKRNKMKMIKAADTSAGQEQVAIVKI